MANLSIYGLTLLYEGTGTIFDELVLPTQLTDKSLITDRLLLDTMELEVLYADPDVFKGALGIYSKSRLHSWQALVDDMFHAYDPFINFTRDEARVNTVTRDLSDIRIDDLTTKRTANLQDERTADLTTERTDDLANGNTRTLSRNAWNGTSNTDMVDAEIVEDSGSDTGTQTTTETGTDTNKTTGTDTYVNTGDQKNISRGTITYEDYFHSQGDSAMYTPTDVARKEFELRAQLSAIEYILADIKTHFCLMVY